MVAALVLAAGARAHTTKAPVLDEAAALRQSQAAIGRTVGDYVFRDRGGRTVRLTAFRGRPLIISMIYTACSQSCPVITQSLADAVDAAQGTFGPDSFAVISVGFDSRNDTPERMRAFAHTQGVNLANWKFLSADGSTVHGLAEDIGFVSFPSAKGFDHLAQVTILDAEGRVYRQVYGETFPPPAVIEPLKQLIFGRKADLTSLSGLINRVRLFCTVYNASEGRYRFDYSILIGAVVGLLSLGAVGIVLMRNLLRVWRTRTEA